VSTMSAINLPPIITTHALTLPPGVTMPGDDSVFMSHGWRCVVGSNGVAVVSVAGLPRGSRFDLAFNGRVIPNCVAVGGTWVRCLWARLMGRQTVAIRFRVERTSKEEKRARLAAEIRGAGL